MVLQEDGTKVGVFSVKEALELAGKEKKDLVEIAPNSDPPVCKIVDCGKYLFQKSKKEKAIRKSQKNLEVKDIRLRPKIAAHDLEIKINTVKHLLEKGHKVRITLMFRGRELAFSESGSKIFELIESNISSIGKFEYSPKQEGYYIKTVAVPTNNIRR